MNYQIVVKSLLILSFMLLVQGCTKKAKPLPEDVQALQECQISATALLGHGIPADQLVLTLKGNGQVKEFTKGKGKEDDQFFVHGRADADFFLKGKHHDGHFDVYCLVTRYRKGWNVEIAKYGKPKFD